jgi:hypothetical protein
MHGPVPGILSGGIMQRQPIKSAILSSVGYDPELQVLEVEFLRTQKEHTRRIYRYSSVPPEKYREMMGLDKQPGEKHSVGSYFLRMIKPNHAFERIEEKNEDQAQSEKPAPPQVD